MSRIGNQIITIPAGITVTVAGQHATVTGPKGTLSVPLHRDVAITIENNTAAVKRVRETNEARAMHGTVRMMLSNAVSGVHTEWTKSLELVGVGYRAQTSGSDLTLSLGFSHPVMIKAPQGITFAVKQNTITISGIDKQQVGEIAAQIRRIRPPEPYKGKGIKYVGEVIRRKAGKAAKGAGSA